MSATIVRLPTADSYYRVRRRGRCCLVELVTPCPGKPPVVSVLYRTVVSDLARAVAEGQGIKMGRPVRLPGGVGMTDTYHEAERQRVLAELRVRRLEAQLFLAHVDHLGLLLRDGLIQSWAARAAIADLDGRPSDGATES